MQTHVGIHSSLRKLSGFAQLLEASFINDLDKAAFAQSKG